METIYIPGDSVAFKAFIDSHYKDKTVELRGIDGKNRWIIKRPDGSEYIARPFSEHPDEGTFKVITVIDGKHWEKVVGSKGIS